MPKGLLWRLYRRFLHKYYVRDINFDLQLEAKREAVAYIRAHMPDAVMFRDRFAQLEWCVRQADPAGLVMEFGVEKGASLTLLAQTTGRPVHGFDSFEGLPEAWTGTYETAGKFNMKGQLPQVPANAKLHVGWFDKTLPPFLEAQSGPVGFLHVDCDLYSSTVTVLEALESRFVPGTIIVFDEYFNYHGWRQHEYKAWQEFVARTGWGYTYIGFTGEKGHVAVRLTEKGTPAA